MSSNSKEGDMFRRFDSTFMKGLACLVLLVGVCTFAPVAEAATHYVPDNYATIQAAIDGAANGDTIMVRPGTYVENINFNGKAVTLKSTDGAESTVIDGNQSGPVVRFVNGEGLDSLIDGFTITNGKGVGGWPLWEGGGVDIYKAAPKIMNCIITGNSARVGGGVRAKKGASPELENCVITYNTASSAGGGIGSYQSYPRLTGCTVSHNSSVHGGAMYAEYAFSTSFVFTDCIFSSNNAGEGGAFSFFRASPFIINSVIVDNTAEGGGGAFRMYIGSPLMINTIIARNSASVGGAFHAVMASPRMVNCTITGNSADSAGAIYARYHAHPNLLNTIMYFNSASEEAVILQSSSLVVNYSDTEGEYGGEGNISADPLFVDSEGGDYHLQLGSPAIDAGVSTGGVPDHDIEGTPRPKGGSHDMGAYENNSCADAPTVEITSVTPDAIWPPNNKEAEVVVSGFISMPEGCTLLDASYAVDDEYGVYTGSGDLYVAEDGSFELVMTVEASRLGSDRDGRVYDVTISATDEAGDASASTEAVVLHDMR
jgi:hypothetical protein